MRKRFYPECIYCLYMSYEYTSRIEWTKESEYHGMIETDKGFSSTFDKPSEFGGKDGTLNPEDAFVASLAMCYSITFKEVCDKMRIDIEEFSLDSVGVIEEMDTGKAFTKVILKPRVKTDHKDKSERALRLAKENCLISKSLNIEIIVEPEIL